MPSPPSPAAGRPLALEKRRRPRDCILFHVAGTAGPETKQHAQGRTLSRQQLPYKIGRLSPSRALDPIKTTCVFPFLPREGEIQACNNTVLLFSSGQKSKLESDKSEISVHFLIGLRGWTRCQSRGCCTSYVTLGADRRNESFRRFKKKLIFP